MSTTGTADATASVLTPHLITSTDGTPIEYFSTGTGPGIVIVHGSPPRVSASSPDSSRARSPFIS